MRFVRTACKAFEKHGNEQSGAHMAFLTLLQNHPLYQLDKVPLASFRGNRFNILFHDAGLLYYLKQAVQEFFETGISTNNRLLKAVEADSKVDEYWAACRALGLVNKHITGPFWRLLESDIPILDMNVQYQHMLTCFEEWADDASSVLNGEAVLFQEYPPKVDKVTECLHVSNSTDVIVQEILQALFLGFIALFNRMVKDHLIGGELDVQESNQRCQETASVPKTNTISERDFAQLDRLLREKPNATTMSLEAMIMFSNNKTSEWLKLKSEEEKETLFKQAREKGPKFRRAFREKREEMITERAMLQRAKQETIAHKRIQARIERERLTSEIISIGLWTSRDLVESGLLQFRSKTAKLKALKVQLDFRRKVLQQTHPEKLIFQSSTKGHPFTVEEMMQNLLCLLSDKAPQFSIPVTLCDDLTGKRVIHRCLVDGRSEWFIGTILSKTQLESSSTVYNIIYDGEDTVLTLDLKKDIEEGEVTFLNL